MYKKIIYYNNNNGDFMIYLIIFVSKILENAIATLRLIVVANGKKKLGALLQGLVSLVWIIVTGIVIVDVNKNIFKIIAFVLGATVGSYLGSIIEEMIALGNNLIIINTKNINLKNILNIYTLFTYKDYIILKIKRKNTKDIISEISNIDNECSIFSIKIKNNYDKCTS